MNIDINDAWMTNTTFDELTIGQGATMARYVAEGVGVTLVTCTGGEMGEILVPELEHLGSDQDDTLADERRIELTNAMKALGVSDHRYLGGFGRYRDSGMKWHEDGHAVAADDVHENAFWNADLTEAASHLVEIIREVRPQVLVTYDQFGGYGHPDHIQAHRVAMYASMLAAIPSYRRELGEALAVRAHEVIPIVHAARPCAHTDRKAREPEQRRKSEAALQVLRRRARLGDACDRYHPTAALYHGEAMAERVAGDDRDRGDLPD